MTRRRKPTVNETLNRLDQIAIKMLLGIGVLPSEFYHDPVQGLCLTLSGLKKLAAVTADPAQALRELAALASDPAAVATLTPKPPAPSGTIH